VFEVLGKEITVLNKAATPPFPLDDYSPVGEDVRLNYRYMDLRRDEMQHKLRFRHKVTTQIRNILDQQGYLDIETPILTRATPEGARDYLVPSRTHQGSFFALPQSPQLFKQLLMVSGFDKYYQIAKCFRDEDLRADRQPEHTQLDFEMSFVHQNDVMDIVEDLYTKIVNEIVPHGTISSPFAKLTYAEAIERFGTDKPDLRFGMELTTITQIASRSGARVFEATESSGGVVRGFVASGCSSYGRRQTDDLTDFAKSSGAQGLVFIALDENAESIEVLEEHHIRSPLKKFLSVDAVKDIAIKMKAVPGDLLLIVAGTEKLVNPGESKMCRINKLKLSSQLIT
jgi:aspartyl-tRNA synthetase